MVVLATGEIYGGESRQASYVFWEGREEVDMDVSNCEAPVGLERRLLR